jgi:hypothetical protein
MTPPRDARLKPKLGELEAALKAHTALEAAVHELWLRVDKDDPEQVAWDAGELARRVLQLPESAQDFGLIAVRARVVLDAVDFLRS